MASAACDLASCQRTLSPADLAPTKWLAPHVYLGLILMLQMIYKICASRICLPAFERRRKDDWAGPLNTLQINPVHYFPASLSPIPKGARARAPFGISVKFFSVPPPCPLLRTSAHHPRFFRRRAQCSRHFLGLPRELQNTTRKSMRPRDGVGHLTHGTCHGKRGIVFSLFPSLVRRNEG